MNVTNIDIEETFNRGMAAQEAGNLQDAFKHFSTVISVEPKNALCLYNMGVIGIKVGRVRSSIDLFKAALTEMPLYESCWVSYIEALIQIDETEQARELIEIAPFQNLSHEQFEKFNEILLNKSTSAVTSLPENITTQLIALYEQNSLDQLLSKCDSLMPEFKNSHILWNIIGATKKRQAALDDAIIAFNNAIKLKNDDHDALNNLGVYWIKATLLEQFQHLKKQYCLSLIM